MPNADAFGVIARIAGSVDVPLTADLEAGYQLPSEELVDRLLSAGGVGCNLEDTDHHGPGQLIPVETQASRLAAVREAARKAGVHVVVNARVDVFRTPDVPPADLMDAALQRGRAYLDAGADCVYPIRLADPALIKAFVEAMRAPVNIMATSSAPPLRELRQLGVARASFAGTVFLGVMTDLAARLDAIRAEAATPDA